MRKSLKYLTLACLSWLCLSCKNEKKPSENVLDKPIAKIEKKNITGYIKTPTGSIYYEDNGQGGLPVVFVHSFAGSTMHWQTQVDHLQKDRRIITLDMRGHGRSDAPNRMQYAVDSLGGDIGAVVDSLNINRFVLVGHSMGGAAAIAYAGAHPERVAGLLLVGTSGKSSEKEAKTILYSLDKEYEKVMEDYTQLLLTNAKPAVDALVREGMKHLSKPTSLSIIKSIFEFDPLVPLKRYTGPTLILYTLAEDEPKALHKQMPNIPHKMIKGTSHWMQMDKPEEFNQILDEFLKTVNGE